MVVEGLYDWFGIDYRLVFYMFGVGFFVDFFVQIGDGQIFGCDCFDYSFVGVVMVKVVQIFGDKVDV